MAKRGAGRQSVDWPLIRTNVRTGVFIGLLMATGYLGWVSIVYVLGGAEAFSSHNVTYLLMVLTYYAVGVVGGAIVGLALPWVNHPFVAILVGILVGWVFFFAIELASSGPVWRWGRGDWRNVAVLGALLGAPGGLIAQRTWSKL